MRLALHSICRGGVPALFWLFLAGSILAAGLPHNAQAVDPLGIDGAASEVRGVLENMAKALNSAPRDVQTTLSADLHLMGQAISRAVNRLEDGEVPIVDPSLVYDLNLLADIARAATDELQAIKREGGLAEGAEHVQRIRALADAASSRLVEVNLVIDGWAERARNAVVELDEEDGNVVVRTTDKLVWNGVRFTSIGLLLVGLLVVGLQLLRMSEDRVDSVALLRDTPVLSSLAVIALLVFFTGCVVFSLRPGTLAALSAEVRQQPQEHPCERLAAQRDRLVAAQQVEHAGLIEATMERMRPAARDCLGLPTEAATEEAVARLAGKAALPYDEPRRPRADGVAVAVAEPRERANDADVMTLPAMPEQEPGEVGEPADEATPDQHAAQLETREAAADEAAAQASAARASAAPPEPPAPEPDIAAITPALGPKPAAPSEDATDAADAAAEPELAAGPDESVPQLKPADLEDNGLAAAGPPVDGVGGGERDLYVTTTTVNYRAGPSVGARRLGTFIPGARVAVVGENEGWSEVRLGDGRQVFVASEFLELAP